MNVDSRLRTEQPPAPSVPSPFVVGGERGGANAFWGSPAAPWPVVKPGWSAPSPSCAPTTVNVPGAASGRGLPAGEHETEQEGLGHKGGQVGGSCGEVKVQVSSL